VIDMEGTKLPSITTKCRTACHLFRIKSAHENKNITETLSEE